MPTHLLKIRIGAEYYCVGLEDIDEVEPKQELRTVPNSPTYTCGMRDYRTEETLEVIDPQIAFNIRGDPQEDNSRIILVLDEKYTHNDRRLGWLISGVEDVIVRKSGEIDTTVTDPGTKGALKDNNEFVVWLDPKELFSELLTQ